MHVLESAVHPRRQWIPDDMPWGAIIVGAGLVVILVVVAVGGRIAYRAIAAAIPPSSAARRVTVAAPSANANARPSKTDAGAIIDRIASAATLPKLLPDTHIRLADERDQIQAEARRLSESRRAGASSDELVGKLIGLTERLTDLTVRWHLLPPMTASEKEALAARIPQDQPAVPAERTGDLNNGDERVLALMVLFDTTERALNDVVQAAAEPPADSANVVERQYDAVLNAMRETARHLAAAASPADLARLEPQFDQAAARIEAAGTALSAASDAGRTAFVEAQSKYALRLSHEQAMLDIVVRYAAGRLMREEVGPWPANLNSATPDVASRIAEFQATLKGVRTQVVKSQLSFVETASRAQNAAGLADLQRPGNLRTGPPPGFPGGQPLAAGNGVVAVPVPQSLEVIIENKIRDFEQQHQGRGNILLVQTHDGTDQQLIDLEREVRKISRTNSFSGVRSKGRSLVLIAYQGDVQTIADGLKMCKVASTDSTRREIVVTFE